MGSPEMFKIINGVQRAVRYFYALLLVMVLYVTIRGYMTSGTEWVTPTLRVFTAIELFLVILYMGIIICIKAFSKVDGDLLGIDASIIVEVWGWLGDKIRDMLVYNGMIGFIMFSLYF